MVEGRGGSVLAGLGGVVVVKVLVEMLPGLEPVGTIGHLPVAAKTLGCPRAAVLDYRFLKGGVEGLGLRGE
jgi:hypothetical protein